MLEHILDHFEALEKQVKNGDFNDHPGIQNSIIEAQNKTKDYYIKIDASITQVAALSLHLRFKFEYFNDNQKDTPRFISTAQTKFKKLWTD